ncbi:tRNA (5-methylaminomethyl-2-thiouridine)(34)-methyltransferase MnmD [Telluribacter sp.]|jgi:tRNA U34 5-methylaminomethyl-2-thiouridine-forming methyltransferase MnmC|uniref:tRNA (5-methylaminomethyl-2-thiouridine)(34)-methyltransferase MnmD n=1 Tax=Telluribacter sp. TaxID=1978767 RepID=UPI002E138D8E|nr:tRNA (5-methylaminomethyl-2-thiouridine)(34)-methyltransferase MnmD [Telluribacter sp.]
MPYSTFTRPGRLVYTADGSNSLYNAALDQHYHSMQGALQESLHVFINLGLKPALEPATSPIRIFEMGFGTGLNALLAWQQADYFQRPVEYLGIEAYPVADEEAEGLNFDEITGKCGLAQLHQAPWATGVRLSDHFTFRKEHTTMEGFTTDSVFDVIFYDAFSPSAQPELWTEEVFARIAAMTRPGGRLVTYSAKGSVRRALDAVGFTVEKHPGPGRKREVVRAIRR